MNLRKQYLTKNDCYKVGKKIIPKGVMLHSTAANNPHAKRYVPGDSVIGVNTSGNHWNQSNYEWKQKFGVPLNKCVHAFIGKFANGSVGTVQTLPWDYRSWHGGGSSNNTHIGFEICEDGLTNPKYFNAVYNEAVELTAMLCKEYKLNPLKDGVVICHSEGHKLGIASNHADVMHWFPKHGKTMDDFRADVSKAMGGSGAASTPKTDASYKVKITADVLNVRNGAGTNYKVVTTVKKNQVYTIIEEKNGWGLLKSKVGWISLKYTTKV